MEESLLEKIGLTGSESIVYISLVESGTCTSGKIIRNTKLQSSTVHNSIKSLIEKGMTSYVIIGNSRHYSAADPEIILDMYKEREEQLKSLVKTLQKKRKNVSKMQSVELYEGIKGIISMLNKLIEDSSPGDKYLFFAIDSPPKNEEIQNFFKTYDIKRMKKKLIIRGIANRKLKKHFSGRKALQIKFINMTFPSNISVINDKTALFDWSATPVGILINSKQIAKSRKDFFNSIWDYSRRQTGKGQEKKRFSPF